MDYEDFCSLNSTELPKPPVESGLPIRNKITVEYAQNLMNTYYAFGDRLMSCRV